MCAMFVCNRTPVPYLNLGDHYNSSHCRAAVIIIASNPVDSRSSQGKTENVQPRMSRLLSLSLRLSTSFNTILKGLDASGSTDMTSNKNATEMRVRLQVTHYIAHSSRWSLILVYFTAGIFCFRI